MNKTIKGFLMSPALVLAASVALAGKPVQAPKVGGMEVFSAGQSVGWVLAFSNPVLIVTAKGYAVRILTHTGEINPFEYPGVRYTGSDCTGEWFLSFLPWEAAQGRVFRVISNAVSIPYYLPRGSTLQRRDYLSTSDRNGICYNDSPGSAESAEVYPNDPAVTGVDNDPYALPITFGIP